MARRVQGDLGAPARPADVVAPAGRRVRLLAAVGTAVSVLFAYLAVRGVDWDVFRSGLVAVDYWLVLPSLAVLAAGVALRALRWQLLFAPEARPPLRPVTAALLIAYFFNNALPARVGELARVVALRRSAGVPRSEGLATVATERMHDVAALLVVLVATLPFAPGVTWLPAAGAVAGVLAVVAVAGAVLLTRYGESGAAFLLRPLRLLPGVSAERTDSAARGVVRGFAGLTRPGVAVPVFALTLASWLVIALSFWILLLGFDFEVSPAAALLVVVATNLALVVPSGPGGIGVFEAATLVALAPFGISRSDALPFAIVLHAVNLVPYLVVGAIVFHRHLAAPGSPRAAPAGERT